MIQVQQYDGEHIPYEDSSIDTVIIIDVLHHTDNPGKLLSESARVAKRQVIIKDHTKTGLLSVIKLRMMDYVGNRHYGVRLPYNYLTKDEWSRLFQENNLIINNYNVSLNLYKGIFHVIFDKGLHFIADLRKLT